MALVFFKRIGISVLLSAVVLLIGILLFRPRPANPVLYKGQSIDAWFFGSKRNFFIEDIREDAQTALNAIGTNAFSFLLSNLRERHGSIRSYFRVHRALPTRVQSWLPYPILDDDIKAITLEHWRKLRMKPVGREYDSALADNVA